MQQIFKLHGSCLPPKPDNGKYDYSSREEKGKEGVKPTTMCIRNGAGVVEDGQMEWISILGVNLHNVTCCFFLSITFLCLFIYIKFYSGIAWVYLCTLDIQI